MRLIYENQNYKSFLFFLLCLFPILHARASKMNILKLVKRKRIKKKAANQYKQNSP